MKTIAERLKSALDSISQTASAHHRALNSVQLLAVSKTKPVSDIVLAYEAGQRLFGENYVQEGVEKVQELQELKDIEWHFIGPLQSNKTRPVAEHFDWVQSVDREKIARRLNDQRTPFKKLNICIQINISEEASKAGVLPDELGPLAEAILAMPNLCLRGLMAIPEATDDPALQLGNFKKMQALFENLQKSCEGVTHAKVDTLSMGMSGDMQRAIEAGSTMVRLGTAIFGSRTQ